MSDRTVLICHGWGGNKPNHWQEWLAAELPAHGVDIRYPKMPDPGSPRLAAWIARLHEEVRQLPAAERVSVVCHSLGAITWMHYSTVATSPVASRVLLVAPPYVSHDLPPADTPPGIDSFFPVPLNAASIRNAAGETSILFGENDCYGTEDQTKAYSDRLDVPLYMIPGAGHVSPYWGYGDWPWMLNWCLGKAVLPPQARD